MRKGDGGPAFPVQVSFDENGEHEFQTGNNSVLRSGISIRDYFAAAAMQSLIIDSERADQSRAECARLSYLMADAMIAAREAK